MGGTGQGQADWTKAPTCKEWGGEREDLEGCLVVVAQLLCNGEDAEDRGGNRRQEEHHDAADGAVVVQQAAAWRGTEESDSIQGMQWPKVNEGSALGPEPCKQGEVHTHAPHRQPADTVDPASPHEVDGGDCVVEYVFMVCMGCATGRW